MRRGPPQTLSVRVRRTADGGLETAIADDAPGERRRRSLEELEERARTLNGVLTVDQGEDAGTTVRVVLPPYVGGSLGCAHRWPTTTASISSSSGRQAATSCVKPGRRAGGRRRRRGGRRRAAGDQDRAVAAAERSSALRVPPSRLAREGRASRERTRARHGYETHGEASRNSAIPHAAAGSRGRTGARHGYAGVTRASRVRYERPRALSAAIRPKTSAAARPLA